MSSEGFSGDPPPEIVRATDAVEELYRVRDTYFPTDPEEKSSRLKTLADAALSVLDSLLPGERRSPAQRAVHEFLKGKILDVFPIYQKEAEDHLSKAVKLNPSLADAWLCLGNCIWKKGDLPSAKNCFSLALNKGPNKKILCQLSMLERRMAQGTENQSQLVEESIRHAKEAVMLDIQDGNSWYILGNACLTNFFVTGAWDHAKLQQSLKAYQNAGQSRTKRLVSLVSSLGEVDLKSSHRKATVNVLTEGRNKGVAVVAKVVIFVKHECVAPLYYVACDSNQTLFVLTVYGLQGEAIKEGDRVTLLEPSHRGIDFSWKNKHYQFKSIRVDFGEQILVNEKVPAQHHAFRASIRAQNKP